MQDPPDFAVKHDPDGAVVMALSGVWTVATVGTIDRLVRACGGPVARLDLARVTAMDTVGAWVAWRAARDHDAVIVNASQDASRLIAVVSASRDREDIVPPRLPLFIRVPEGLGRIVVELAKGSIGMIGFTGALIEAGWLSLLHPRRLRVTAIFRQIELVGVDSLGIIALMSFLIGVVIAQQGAVQLQQFGAQIYTINLTGRLAMRELGILMTAIMIAGRSGSAFAAQIGTMKLTEEVDAMRTIGVSPMDALVLPRVVASVLMMPLLGFYASVIAIIGGATVSAVLLDIPFWTFIQRIQEVVPVRDLWVGLVKGPVFGLIVALTGCFQGMQVKGNSEEVGLRTTLAVVQAIFAVIVIDAFFAVFFSEVGWI